MVKAVKINLNWLFNNPKMVPIKTTNCPIQLITEKLKKLSPLEHFGKKKIILVIKAKYIMLNI